MDKTALEHLLSSYNWWMGISTVGVAVGILGEYVAHFVFEKEARRNKLELAISILCGVLVLGGVVGEWIFGSKLAQASERLQRIADTEVASSNAQAEAAHREAETARKEADSFELDIAKAKKDSANAGKEAARLNKRGEEERLARVKIEQQIAWRTLAPEQQRRIRDKVLLFSGQQFIVATYLDDPECVALLRTVGSIAVAAGWKFLNSPPGGLIGLMPLEQGVILRLSPSSNETTKHAADTLAAALNQEGVVTKILVAPEAPADEIQMRVGKKP